MQTSAVLHNLESSLQNQLALVTDPAIEAGGRAVLSSLHPALKEAALELVNQAADEVRAQLPGYRVEVMLSDGEPSLASPRTTCLAQLLKAISMPGSPCGFPIRSRTSSSTPLPTRGILLMLGF